MALNNVSIPVALLVKVRVKGVEKLKPIVDRSMLFSLCARRGSGQATFVVFFGFLDDRHEFLLVCENSPPRFERGTIKDRRPKFLDAASLDNDWLKRDAQWEIHEEREFLRNL